SLKYISELKPKHISWYSLMIAPHTVVYKRVKKGQMKVDDDEAEGEKYMYIMGELAKLGYPQYEISNFSEREYESAHHKTYWKNDEYFGLGAGSHGYVDGKRDYNIKPGNHYIQAMGEKGSAVKETVELTLKEQTEEEMILGMRMNRGVDIQRLEA